MPTEWKQLQLNAAELYRSRDAETGSWFLAEALGGA
jgi:hypothetical protein